MMEPTDLERRALDRLPVLADPKAVRTMMENARREGSALVEKAAFMRLVSLLPEEAPGTLEYDFWTSIHATEEMKRQESGKNIKLSRTRQKIARVGIYQMVVDLVRAPKQSEVFDKMMEFGTPQLTAEAIVLRHRERFDDATIEAAERRLVGAQVNIEALKR